LGELRATEASEPLLRLLGAADPDVRIHAAAALGRIGAEEALPDLRQLVLHDNDDNLRTAAIYALGDIGDPEGVDLLLPFLRDSSFRVRIAAAYTLGRLGDSRSIPALRAARPRLLRSPLDWYLSRRVYDGAIDALSD
jgi:HEAT repeat protein